MSTVGGGLDHPRSSIPVPASTAAASSAAAGVNPSTSHVAPPLPAKSYVDPYGVMLAECVNMQMLQLPAVSERLIAAKGIAVHEAYSLAPFSQFATCPHCTFSLTKDKHAPQPWRRCFTCNLTGQKGVCLRCAERCHAGHDLSEERYSNFFCDCGVRIDS